MKICFYTDVHWSQDSSIIRSRGDKYSSRLENLIQSMNWAEQLAFSQDCGLIVCGGDFFDSSQLNSEEISALKEIEWAPATHIFLTGNHETNVKSLEYSTSDLFNLCNNCVTISEPGKYQVENCQTEICFLPYVLDSSNHSIGEYFGNKSTPRIIFSHNDLKDVQYGSFLSTEGFTISDIEDNCDLFINGHIHHCAYVTNKIINGGNLTGQNFTEDATKYKHCALIIDLDTLEVKFFVNPHAYNFYKLDLTDVYDVQQLESDLSDLSSNSVLTMKFNEQFVADARFWLDTNKNRLGIAEYRVLVEHTQEDTPSEIVPTLCEIDHLAQFESFILSEVGNTNIIQEELREVLHK